MVQENAFPPLEYFIRQKTKELGNEMKLAELLRIDTSDARNLSRHLQIFFFFLSRRIVITDFFIYIYPSSYYLYMILSLRTLFYSDEVHLKDETRYIDFSPFSYSFNQHRSDTYEFIYRILSYRLLSGTFLGLISQGRNLHIFSIITKCIHLLQPNPTTFNYKESSNNLDRF